MDRLDHSVKLNDITISAAFFDSNLRDKVLVIERRFRRPANKEDHP